MDDEFTKPYKKLQAVAELQEQNDLVDLYVHLFKEKYKTAYIVPVDRSHFKHIKTLRESMGPKALGILYAYFESRDDWFVKQQHSLECLIKNLNKVNQALLTKERVSELRDKLLINLHCDACWKSFDLICPPTKDIANSVVLCPVCEADDKAPYRPTKEERRKALRLISNAFPEVKKDVDIP